MSFPGPEQVAEWGAPPRQARRKAPVIVLAVLAALFAVATGVFTVLYIGEQAEADRVAAMVAEKQTQVDAARDELDKAEDEADAALDDLKAKEAGKAGLRTEKDEVIACNAAAKAYLAAPADVPEAEGERLFNALFDACRFI